MPLEGVCTLLAVLRRLEIEPVGGLLHGGTVPRYDLAYAAAQQVYDLFDPAVVFLL